MVSEKYRLGLLPSDGCDRYCRRICTDSEDCARFSLKKEIYFAIKKILNVVFHIFLADSLNFGLYFFILLCSQRAPEWSSDDETKELHTVAPVPTQTNHVQTEGLAPCHSYRKSLRLSSDQIVR